jgi:hypothetical protein
MSAQRKRERLDVMLEPEQTTWLDGLRTTIRENTGEPCSRSELLRLMVWAFQEGGLGFRTCKSSEDVLAELLRFERNDVP